MKRKTKQDRVTDAAFDSMARALGRYIKCLGGSALVVSGTGVGKNPGSLKYNYFIQFDITGKMPTKKRV